MNNILENIKGQFELKIEDSLLIKIVAALSFVIILFFILKSKTQ